MSKDYIGDIRLKWLTRKSVLALLSTGALGVLALLGGGVYFLGSPGFEDLAADYTVGEIESRTGMSVSLEDFEADFWGQTFTLSGLELRGEEDASDAPLLSVPRIAIGFRLRSLLSRRIDLWSLEIDRPAVFLRIGEGGQTNIPPAPPREGEGWSFPLEVAIGDFALSEGSFIINESRVDVDFGLSDVQGLFDWAEASRVLSGANHCFSL